MGFALTFANFFGYTSRKSELGYKAMVVSFCSKVWSLGYLLGRQDLILVLKPKAC
jgi:hypothetical protein